MKNLLQGSVREISNKHNCTCKHQDSEIVYIKIEYNKTGSKDAILIGQERDDSNMLG